MRTLRTMWVLFVLAALPMLGATRHNDDSCDIGVAPAATLLLPYFEVDLDSQDGERTIFTITNVTNADRIARVTLWTDWAFPVLTFNVPLTGYGVQSISLHDVLDRGVIARPGTVRRGRYSKTNRASACDDPPEDLPEEVIAYMQTAFTEGNAITLGDVQGCYNIGAEHDNAVGYATIDLVRNCSTNNPFAEEYWTEDLAFDNVLIGDYQQIHSANNFAQGSPLVHIRAIPEGGTPAERMVYHREHGFQFARTFYGHYQPAHAPRLDSRQPLPSTFSVRWIDAGFSGFQTFYKIWREGVTGPGATCATHDDNDMKLLESVKFDEAENAVGVIPVPRITPIRLDVSLPATSLTDANDPSLYPSLANGAIGGWMYFNLDNSNKDADGSSNWVVASMRAEGRYSADMDAAPLGNGCSSPAPMSETTTGTGVIGPRP